LTFPYAQQSFEPLPWPHQAPDLTPQQIELLNQQVWVINDFPLYQADEAGDHRYFHGGLDIVLDNGTPIYAMKDGWVKFFDYGSGTIGITDIPGDEPSYGWEYTHLGNFQVEVGDFVTAGTFIGEVDFPQGLAHIHLTKVFSQGPYWGGWRYMCVPNGHFTYIDEEPPVINTPFYFFENNSDTIIEPDGTGNVVLSGQVDIVVPMREQGLYARSNDSGFGDRLGITTIVYEIRPAGSDPGSGHLFQSFDFNKIKIKSGFWDTYYNAQITKVVYKHWTLFEPNRTSGDKSLSYYIITNCSGERSPRKLHTDDRNYCWDTAALDQDGYPLYLNGTYDIIVTAYDFDGHSSSQTMRVTVGNPEMLVPDQFPTIQDAINAAVDGDIISVAPGIYEEEIDFLGKEIIVQGNPGAAIIDGVGGCAVSFFSDEGPRSILRNFVIRNGYMGIFLADSSPTIHKVTVCDNEYGVAAFVGAQPVISNSIFWNNTEDDLLFCQVSYTCIEDANDGVGNITNDPLFVDPDNGDYHLKSEAGRWDPDSQSWVADDVTSPCIDKGNPTSLVWAEHYPHCGRVNMGAYGNTSEASRSQPGCPTIQDAIDAANHGETVIIPDGIYMGPGNRDIDFKGKAITLQSENGPANCIIDCRGTATHPRRGFYFHSGEDASSVVEGFTIMNGYAQFGGGILCEDSSPKITNCVFQQNTAEWYGGAMENYYSSPVVSNCIFSGNRALDWSFGGAIDNYVSSPTITNCTFHNNSADYGGAIFDSEQSTTVTNNCILWANNSTCGPEICGTCSVLYCNVQGGYAGTGNIDTDPLFVDGTGGDYHLLHGSPAIDAGDPASDWGNEPWPNGRRVNLGAYGNTAQATRSKTDFEDLAMLADHWLQDGPFVDVAPEPDGDGIINFADFAVLAHYWAAEQDASP
jgi:hypothetical protein